MNNILLILTLAWSSQTMDSKIMDAYLQSYADVAKAEMRRTGIPASIKLAQGMLESDYGRSALANKANNHFGIKCGNDWDGKSYYIKDDDYSKQGDLLKSCFRVFESPMESYIAHSEFITNPKKAYRYGSLFELPVDDYTAWAYGLKNAGYATDSKYPEKLIFIIEKYNLHQYDLEVLGDGYRKKDQNDVVIQESKNKPKAQEIENDYRPKTASSNESKNGKRIDIKVINNSRYVLPWAGETTEDLANRVGISVDDILAYNDHILYPSDKTPINIPVYLEQKNRDFKGPIEVHVVKEGETIDDISQLYGVRVNTLLTLNRIGKNGTPLAGEKINLKTKVKGSHKPKSKRKERSRFVF